MDPVPEFTNNIINKISNLEGQPVTNVFSMFRMSNNLVDTDISAESSEVQAIASAVWTTSIKNAYKAFLIATRPS